MLIKPLQLTLILTALMAVNCTELTKHEVTENKELVIGDKMFEEAIYNSYTENGKYYIIKCASWFDKRYTYGDSDTNTVFEIKVNDVILGMPDEHNSILYKVEKLDGNDIQIETESSFDHRSFGVNKITEHKSHFIIHCSGKKDSVRLIIDGLEVNAESAKKHVAQGKFYALMKYDNKHVKSGIDLWTNKDCRKQAFDKLGYYQYIIDDCVPTVFHRKQIEAYNKTIFDYLKKKKGLAFEQYNEMGARYIEEYNKCVKEAYNKRNLPNSPLIKH